MITDDDLKFVSLKRDEPHGFALCWVIQEECTYDLALNLKQAKIFFDHDEVVDVSDLYPEHEGITVRFLKNNEVIEELQTSEKFGSILLSSPKVINLSFHKNGASVVSPDAIFIDYDFIVKGGVVFLENGWTKNNTPPDLSIKCYNKCDCDNCKNSCQCGWSK